MVWVIHQSSLNDMSDVLQMYIWWYNFRFIIHLCYHFDKSSATRTCGVGSIRKNVGLSKRDTLRKKNCQTCSPFSNGGPNKKMLHMCIHFFELITHRAVWHISFIISGEVLGLECEQKEKINRLVQLLFIGDV